MSFIQSKIDIESILKDLGFTRNPINKKVSQDFHDKFYSINQIESLIKITEHIGNYIFDIDLAFNVNSNEQVDESQVLFDEVVRRISKLDSFINFNKNPIIKQKDKDSKKLIGNLNFLIDNYYC